MISFKGFLKLRSKRRRHYHFKCIAIMMIFYMLYICIPIINASEKSNVIKTIEIIGDPKVKLKGTSVWIDVEDDTWYAYCDTFSLSVGDKINYIIHYYSINDAFDFWMQHHDPRFEDQVNKIHFRVDSIAYHLPVSLVELYIDSDSTGGKVYYEYHADYPSDFLLGVECSIARAIVIDSLTSMSDVVAFDAVYSPDSAGNPVFTVNEKLSSNFPVATFPLVGPNEGDTILIMPGQYIQYDYLGNYRIGEFHYPYLPGDANMSAGLWPPQVIGSDVTFLVNYFRGISTYCLVDGFYASADANGDCMIIGSDVTFMVNYFRAQNPILYCPDFPPAWGDGIGTPPATPPSGWPNCDF